MTKRELKIRETTESVYVVLICQGAYSSAETAPYTFCRSDKDARQCVKALREFFDSGAWGGEEEVFNRDNPYPWPFECVSWRANFYAYYVKIPYWEKR
jgi:hypothetical protein